MSNSSLWVLDKEYKGIEIAEFSNSWYFAPIVWDILFQKYLSERAVDMFGNKTTYMSASMFDSTIEPELNKRVNKSDVIEDRIAWELSCQQIFFSKDKDIVANAIRSFLEINKEFTSNCGDHIFERFNE